MAQTTPVKPNFVFILTVDMRKADLKYMPKTRALLKTQGMQFQNAFDSNPVSRSFPPTPVVLINWLSTMAALG
jgi:hypothetical protein